MIYTSKGNVKWYLHKRKQFMPRNKVEVTSYYFRKTPNENYCKEDLPIKYTVVEYKSLPFIKKV